MRMTDFAADRPARLYRSPTVSPALRRGWFLLLAAALAVIGLGCARPAAAPASAPDPVPQLPAPARVAAVNGSNPGEAVISWHPVDGAAFYRLAWIAAADAAAITKNDGDWMESIASINLPAAADTNAVADTAAAASADAATNANADADDAAGMHHTLTRLNPDASYTFLVGSLPAKTGTPAWSAPAELNLASGTLAPDRLYNVTVPVGLTTNEPGAFGGYTLFAAKENADSFLIDASGQLIRRWEQPLDHIKLLENGNVLGSKDGTMYEIDPAGNLLWEYHHPERQHHDFLLLPNGNLLLLLRETKSPAEVIAAGANPAFVHPDGLDIDTIIEVRRIYPDAIAVAWKWSVWDHLVQDYDPAKANFGIVAQHPELVDLNYNLRQASRTERNHKTRMLHANGLDYNPELDQIIISARDTSEIWIIDHSTTTVEAAGHRGGNSGQGGDLLYRWGNPQTYRAGSFADQQLFWQHNPYWIPEGLPGAGNILIFNNGDGYEGRYLDHSSVVEITPPASGYGYARREGGGVRYGPTQPTWTYTAANPPDFISRRLSNAQRLPNGNTLIVSGQDGVIFEVTPAGATVWRYVSPVVSKGPIYQGDPIRVQPAPQGGAGPFWRNFIYRAYRYAPDYQGLQHYDLTPQGTVELYRDGTATPAN